MGAAGGVGGWSRIEGAGAEGTVGGGVARFEGGSEEGTVGGQAAYRG
jgi:hypothetical protein